MWIDLFISCNMVFAYLALLESMVVVLLQDKRTKTFFPQEWQWAIEKILWKKKDDPSSAFVSPRRGSAASPAGTRNPRSAQRRNPEPKVSPEPGTRNPEPGTRQNAGGTQTSLA